MKYIENVYITTDVVHHYSWLDSMKIDISLINNDYTKQTIFKNFLCVFISLGLKKYGKITSKIHSDGKVLFIVCDGVVKTSIFDNYLVKTCDYYIENTVNFKGNNPTVENYYQENIEAIKEFFGELKDFITNNKAKYYYQAVDGFN